MTTQLLPPFFAVVFSFQILYLLREVQGLRKRVTKLEADSNVLANYTVLRDGLDEAR